MPTLQSKYGTSLQASVCRLYKVTQGDPCTSIVECFDLCTSTKTEQNNVEDEKQKIWILKIEITGIYSY